MTPLASPESPASNGTAKRNFDATKNDRDSSRDDNDTRQGGIPRPLLDRAIDGAALSRKQGSEGLGPRRCGPGSAAGRGGQGKRARRRFQKDDPAAERPFQELLRNGAPAGHRRSGLGLRSELLDRLFHPVPGLPVHERGGHLHTVRVDEQPPHREPAGLRRGLSRVLGFAGPDADAEPSVHDRLLEGNRIPSLLPLEDQRPVGSARRVARSARLLRDPPPGLRDATLSVRTETQTAAADDIDDERRGWYEWTMLAWAGGVWVFQMVYMELCFCNELVSCHKLLKHRLRTKTLAESIKVNLLLAQRQKYSGTRMERYLVENLAGKDDDDPSATRTDFSRDATYQPVQIKYTPGTRWTKLPILRWCYDRIEDRREDYQLLGLRQRTNSNCSGADNRSSVFDDDEDDDGDDNDDDYVPNQQHVKRNYTIDEIFGNVTIITRANWSLERLWCVNQRRVTDLIVVSGKDSVTQFQFLSGYLCVAFATLLIIVVLTGCLIWIGKPLKDTILIIVLVFAIGFFPMIVSLHKVRQHQVNKNLSLENHMKEEATRFFDQRLDRAGDDGDSCEVLISIWESVRITELKEWACYATAAIEIVVLFVWPLFSLFLYENTHIGIVFLVFGLHGLPRHYFNASYFLQEFGRIDDLDLTEADLSPCWSCSSKTVTATISIGDERLKKDRDLNNKALIANNIKRVTRSRAKSAWIYFLLFFFFVISIAYYTASHEDMFSYTMGRYKWKGVVYADGFHWDPQPQLSYPSCEIQKGFSFPGEQTSSLASYSFLATLAFSSPEESQPLLDQWFGEGRVIDDYEYVESFRRSTGTENHPVAYKLYTFADDPTSGIVGIRGSEAMWDWMVDMQLWAGSLFAQGIRNLNPLGFLWDPILDEVVYMINSVQSQNLKEVSYYRFTTEFVEALYSGYEGRTFDNLRVTGASLGGGVAILTGAITGASAIAFSGLNAMFSRRTFLPPITREQLNTRVFNTIPERDPIANIDKPGMLYQRMQCIGPEIPYLLATACFERFAKSNTDADRKGVR
eukprot:CAMPEP_0197180138 /NCGR_PEP_ID=MMETSP1423-20130617/4847_1 /TAXON_ID=476441 /ORGANISM="Pseudo-nitzschia heimii, Strain UNC1101" /LENGTH=1026 /DNA_ID=CAMNT_0042630161 /DNA_START=184 /DNA_END=3265 /DNA_ORIENTATION=+